MGVMDSAGRRRGGAPSRPVFTGLWFRVGVAAAALAGVGCAGFRGGGLDETREWPPSTAPGAKKPSLSLSLVGKAQLNGKPLALTPATIATWHRWSQEAYVSSGLFSEVLPPGAPSDLVAEIEATDTGSGSMALAVISGLTLTIIPCRSKDEFGWKTTLKDKAGNVRGVIEKKEASIMWIELLLIFVFPFSSPASTTHEVLTDLNRATILDARERGYLGP